MSLETKSKSFLVHEIERLQSVIKEKDVEIALLKEGAEKAIEQPNEPIIQEEPKPNKKHKFSFEKDE